MLVLVLIGVLIVAASFIGYTIGADKLEIVRMEADHFRASRDRAVEDAEFWKRMYLGPRTQGENHEAKG